MCVKVFLLYYILHFHLLVKNGGKICQEQIQRISKCIYNDIFTCVINTTTHLYSNSVGTNYIYVVILMPTFFFFFFNKTTTILTM